MAGTCFYTPVNVFVCAKHADDVDELKEEVALLKEKLKDVSVAVWE